MKVYEAVKNKLLKIFFEKKLWVWYLILVPHSMRKFHFVVKDTDYSSRVVEHCKNRTTTNEQVKRWVDDSRINFKNWVELNQQSSRLIFCKNIYVPEMYLFFIRVPITDTRTCDQIFWIDWYYAEKTRNDIDCFFIRFDESSLHPNDYWCAATVTHTKE